MATSRVVDRVVDAVAVAAFSGMFACVPLRLGTGVLRWACNFCMAFLPP